jgi:hypothetical protein
MAAANGGGSGDFSGVIPFSDRRQVLLLFQSSACRQTLLPM